MGISIAGLLVFGVLFSGILALSRSGLVGEVMVTDATRGAVELVGERNRTAISIASGPTISTADGSCTLTAGVKNTGYISIAEYSDMDVVLQLTEGNNAPQRLPYSTASTPATGDWSKSFVSTADLFEPGILSLDETMTITGTLSLPQAGDTTGKLTVGAPNGITAEGSFSLETPCP